MGRESLLERLVRGRGIAWLPLPRESPSKLIFCPSLVDPMWCFAYASNMNRRQLKHGCSALCYAGWWLGSMVTPFSSSFPLAYRSTGCVVFDSNRTCFKFGSLLA
jgi:hypothetical protein